MLIFKNAFFKTAYSNIPLLKKSPNLFRKKILSLTPLPPSLTFNYPFASTTRQFATPNSCLSRSQTPIQASKFQPYSLCRCVFFFFFWLNYKCISFSLFMHVNVYYVMGFRPNYFTCIVHLYLYYTLLVPHTYALLYKALMYIFSL